MSIELTPQLESALADEASRRGTTPQVLAEALLRAQLPQATPSDAAQPQPPPTSAAPPRTMLDRLKPHLESLPKPPPGTPPTHFSQDTGRRFAEAMVEKRRQGRL